MSTKTEKRKQTEADLRRGNREWIVSVSKAGLMDLALWLNAADPITVSVAIDDLEEGWGDEE